MFILGPNVLINVRKSSGDDAICVGKFSFDMSVLEVLAVISSYRDQHRKTISSKQDEARACEKELPIHVAREERALIWMQRLSSRL